MPNTLFMFLYMSYHLALIRRRKWQPSPVLLSGESQGWGSLVGFHLWDHTESDTTEVMQQQQPSWVFCKGVVYKVFCVVFWENTLSEDYQIVNGKLKNSGMIIWMISIQQHGYALMQYVWQVCQRLKKIIN